MPSQPAEHVRAASSTLAWRADPGRRPRCRCSWPGRLLAVAAALAIGPGLARAQDPAEPRDPAAAGEDRGTTIPRIALAGEASVTVGPQDRDYFNYTDYKQNALRLFIGTLGASYLVTPWLNAVAEVRVENTDRVRLSALYARVRPWRTRGVTFAIGRIPPVFGAFARTRYGSDNPLISRPLPYQYLSTLRPDAVPLSADALLAVRGEGWYVRYPELPSGAGGSRSSDGYDAGESTKTATGAAGVPLVSTSRWDTGLVAHLGTASWQVSGGVTAGSLSDPRVEENNSGKQVVGRVEWQPGPAWTLGVSAARGAFLGRAAARDAGTARDDWPQQALGLDAAFSMGYLRIRGEWIVSSWEMPAVLSPFLDAPLDAAAAILEARYRLHPRLDFAVRGDWIGFSSIQGTLNGGRPTPWDADVSRVECGVGVRLARGWVAKTVYQWDWRFGASRTTRGYPAAQLAVWF